MTGLAFPLWPTAWVVTLALVFYYFLLAGARTFIATPGDDLGSGLAQASFIGTGTIATMFLGYRAAIPPANAVARAVLLMASLALYEWARRTIRDRQFHIAWSGDVPEAVCEAGPYKWVRHPVYLAYMLAFAAVAAALPGVWSALIVLANVALFTHAAITDERDIGKSDLAADYAAYRTRAGMFWPLLFRR